MKTHALLDAQLGKKGTDASERLLSPGFMITGAQRHGSAIAGQLREKASRSALRAAPFSGPRHGANGRNNQAFSVDSGPKSANLGPFAPPARKLSSREWLPCA
jgi:hypothetical protein